MATSPIYSWPEPDNTDLVKNGALAIRTLGNAIDTTMGTMVAKTVVDAKGDLIAGTAADTVNRLAVGNNGETLVADSSTSTGLRYQAPVNANPVINSNFSVWQRGTSIASGAAAPYTADRWQIGRGGNAAGVTVSRQVTGDTTNLPFIQYCARVQRDSGNTSTAQIYFMQSFETVNSIPFAGKTVTYSFYARRGANYSEATNNLAMRVDVGTGTDQNVFTGYTGSSSPLGSGTPVTLTTTWQRFSTTFAVPSTTTEIGIFATYLPGGTAGANDYFEITGVQLEVGSVATPYKPTGATFQGELAACQRYYEQFEGNQGNAILCVNQVYTTTETLGSYYYKVEKRTAPTIAISGGTSGALSASASVVNGSVGFQDINAFFTRVTITGASGLVAGNASGVYLSYAKVTISAEL